MPHTFRPQEVSVYLNKNVNIRSSQKPTSENTIRNLVICTWNRFQLLITIHDDNHRNAEISMAFQGAGERNIKILVQKWAYGTPVCVCQFLSRVRLFVTPWTVAHQAPLSMGLSRQEYWRGLSFPSPGDLPDSEIEPGSPVLQADPLPSELPGEPYSTPIQQATIASSCKHKRAGTFSLALHEIPVPCTLLDSCCAYINFF